MNTRLDNTLRFLSKLKYIQLYNRRYMAANYPVLAYPLDMTKCYLSQAFGVNAPYYTPMLGHDGLDFGALVGSFCRAPIAHTIIDLILQTNGYGRHAVCRDEYGHVYIYGHLHEFFCAKGDHFERGEVFASTGGNLDDPYHGYSTGPHLHWEWRPVWANPFNGYGGAEDQTPYITYDASIDLPTPRPIATAYVTNPNKPTLGLNVRSKQGTGPVIDELEPGESMEIFRIRSAGQVFAQIDPYADRWVTILLSKKPYVTFDEVPEE